jgi:hypothetical protein
MVDQFDRVDRIVIPLNAEIRDITNLWRKILDVPDELILDCARHNDLECHWGFREGRTVGRINCTLISNSNRGNANIYDGSDACRADQIGRRLDVKVPPFTKCQVIIKDTHVTITQPDEWIPLALRVLKERNMAFQLEGRLIEDPSITSWWFPYNYGAIMRYGNSVNSNMPPDPTDAEFSPQPWPERVIIRIKSARPPPT